MLSGYEIELQEVKDELVAIKAVNKCVSTDKLGNKTGMFPLKSAEGNVLPCLKVKVSHPDHPDHRFEIRWSNYYEDVSGEPGKFKLVRVDYGQPVFLYQTDHNGRKRNCPKTGKPLIDYVEMAKQFGSEPDGEYRGKRFIQTGWNWGSKQKFIETVLDMDESSNIDGITAILNKRFGEDLTLEILELFINEDLFTQFVGFDTGKRVARLAAA